MSSFFDAKGEQEGSAWCKHYRHGLEKDAVLCSAPPNKCKDTQHPTWRKYKTSFLVGVRGLHTTRSIA